MAMTLNRSRSRSKLEALEIVLDLACLTADRLVEEQTALLEWAERIDKEANRQTGTNVLLKDQPYGPCTYKDGPPETHGRCRCSHPDGRVELREPRGGWRRWDQIVRSSWQPDDPGVTPKQLAKYGPLPE